MWHLENIDVTQILCPNKIGATMDNHGQRRFKKGEYVYLPEEDANRIFFLTEGRVKIGHFTTDNREMTIAILGKGEVFGEMAAAGVPTRRDFAYVLEDTKVCVIGIEELKVLMREHTTLQLFFMKLMSSRLLTMESRLESLMFKDSRTRIIDFLIEMVETKGQRVGYEMLVRSFMTHQDMANLTATARQTVTTVLNDLRDKNIISFNRQRLLVRDMDLLRKQGK